MSAESALGDRRLVPAVVVLSIELEFLDIVKLEELELLAARGAGWDGRGIEGGGVGGGSRTVPLVPERESCRVGGVPRPLRSGVTERGSESQFEPFGSA